ncbi:MAG: hypothetical protein JST45_11010 [Bacteroidetes bacterium]|nr:hypothetical protein [Bacteroidota bacterium]
MRLLAPIGLLLVFASCGPDSPKSLCERYFKPWPDVISQRERTNANSDLMEAMAAYSDKNYEQAITGLQRVLDRDANDMQARLYMANAQLAAGHPYKAEMHLDFLENYKARAFKDQVEWYNALCWLCEGDTAKAGQQVRWIASRPHTYRQEASELAAALANP